MAVSSQDQSEDNLAKDTPKVELSKTTPREETTLQPPCEEPQISLLALSRFSVPQTLKLIGYIKNHKVIILIDSNNTHSFIHKRVAEETHCYSHVVHYFRIMIAYGDMVKCGGLCENLKLQMGEYHLKYDMFAIEMGGCDVVLDAK
jgi:hypothetical protein